MLTREQKTSAMLKALGHVVWLLHMSVRTDQLAPGSSICRFPVTHAKRSGQFFHAAEHLAFPLYMWKLITHGWCCTLCLQTQCDDDEGGDHVAIQMSGDPNKFMEEFFEQVGSFVRCFFLWSVSIYYRAMYCCLISILRTNTFILNAIGLYIGEFRSSL